MKIISTALFGAGDDYAQYLPALVLGTLNLHPRSGGWQLRIHVDDLVANSRHGGTLARLASEKLIELRRMGEAEYTKAMLWRVAPVFDEGVEYVFCRDFEAAPMPRDRACMERFIASKMTVHTVHDNPYHIGVMGGLCGFHARSFRESTGLKSLDDLYKFAGNVNWMRKGVDQLVLNRLVIAHPAVTLLEHRYNGWSGTRPGQLPPKKRGLYGCTSVSEPVPDHGAEGAWTDDGMADTMADRLGMHLGCAGYDIAAARAFWEEHGDSEIARVVRACES